MTNEELYEFLWSSSFFQNADVLYHSEDLESLSDLVAHLLQELKKKGIRTPSSVLLDFFAQSIEARQTVSEGCLEHIVTLLTKIIKIAQRFNATKDKTEKQMLLDILKLYKII